jgi:protein-L-isoaspartate O-methyltransferase
LVEQLAEDGIMVIPVGGVHETQKFMELTKKEGKVVEKFITHVRYVPLTDLQKQII